MQERRKSPRITLPMVLQICRKGELIKKVYAGGIDLSIIGIGIETYDKFNLGEDVILKLTLPLEIQGKIRWVKSSGKLNRYGIKFTKIGFLEKINLKKYIKAQFDLHKKK